MAINRDKPDLWKCDINKSVDLYNQWFMAFAPKAFRDTRISTARTVEEALKITGNLTNLSASLLKSHPEVLPILRMSTCPPIARDRLIGLSGVSKSLVQNMEDINNPRISPRMSQKDLEYQLECISGTIVNMLDPDIFVWLSNKSSPSEIELQRASTIVADRLCGAISDPIIRNAQEKRQLFKIAQFLEERGYHQVSGSDIKDFREMKPGTFSFRTNIAVRVSENAHELKINIPIDVIIMPLLHKVGELPILIEAKSAGDFTNVNKRRKEEAQKMVQLRGTYGDKVKFGLFLCGYFDSGYLGYEAAEGIDWVWEHRIEDLLKYNI